MALANYTDLQAAALDWMTRAGQTGKTADWVTLAEARLNRELGVVETDASLTGTALSRTIDISSLSMTQPIALFLAETGRDEVWVTPHAAGTFPQLSTAARPSLWAIDSDTITFDCPLDSDYPFRFRYRERFSLALTTTNSLLTDHPDIYLAAVLMWGAGYNESWEHGTVWRSTLEDGIASVLSNIAQNKRSVSTVDPALTAVGRRWRYGYNGVD